MANTSPLPTRADVRLHLAGEWLTALPDGGLWWESARTLIVSDLHLEKGSSYAARGQLLPPYDTRTTLAIIQTMCAAYAPQRIISLGDSFHDGEAEARLAPDDIEMIKQFTGDHDWVWVEGNHDPDPPKYLGGRASKALTIGPLTFRHEPTGARAEIAGHLHPAAKVRGHGRSVRRRCFICDGDRLIMPALGAFTGGLNVLDPAFEAIFPDGFSTFALGGERVFTLPRSKLIGDASPASKWRY